VGKNTSPEEHFTLTYTVQVRIQLQGFDLEEKINYDTFLNKVSIILVMSTLTMMTQACFPSIKPLGMAFGVRISYLKLHLGKKII